MGQKTILIADDDESFRTDLVDGFKRSGFQVSSAADGPQALEVLLEKRPDVALIDIRMPGRQGVPSRTEGLEVITRAKKAGVHCSFIVMTGHIDFEIGREIGERDLAISQVSKPKTFEVYLEHVRRAIAVREDRELASTMDVLGPIAAKSQAMLDLFVEIGRAAKSAGTVLIVGETGTGKELVATAFHRATKRQYPLIRRSCGELSNNLDGSELLGIGKGVASYVTARAGWFVQAHQGTLLLDEIATLSLDLQATLLRVIETNRVTPLGTAEEIDVDVRVIAATSSDLNKGVEEGWFRKDLYHRFRTILRVPPLRDRREDIPLIVQNFMNLYHHSSGITEAALNQLCDGEWPGNVRELRNVIENAALKAVGRPICPGDLQLSKESAREHPWYVKAPLDQGLDKTIDDVQRYVIVEVGKKVGFAKTKTADLLGIPTARLYARIKDLGLTNYFGGEGKPEHE